MSKSFRPLLLATVVAAGASFTAQAQEKKPVMIFNWANYNAAETLADFKASTGYDTSISAYDTEEMMFAKVMAGSTGYDVVVTNAQPQLANALEAGAYMELDRSQLPNWNNQDAAILATLESADPGNRHAAIYTWGTIGMGYNVDKVKAALGDAPIDSWSLMFDPEQAAKFKDCGIAFMDAPANMYPLMLNYLGLDPNTRDPADIEKATVQFEKIRPYIKSINSANLNSETAAGNFCLVATWNGDAIRAADRAREANNGQNISFVMPREGGIIWIYGLAIPKDAPNPEGAYAFLNHMLEPKAAAEATNAYRYANAVPASVEFMDPSIANDERLFPNDESKKSLFMVEPADRAIDRAMTRGWTRFKAGQ